MLKQGLVHIAGTHLRDEATGESNLPAVRRRFASKSVAVIGFALWEEGIVVGRGNPKSIREIADFARKDIVIVNREPGRAAGRCWIPTRTARHRRTIGERIRPDRVRTPAGGLARFEQQGRLLHCDKSGRTGVRIGLHSTAKASDMIW